MVALPTHALAIIASMAMATLTACGGEGGGSSTPAIPAGLRLPPTTNADALPPAVPFDSATPRTLARAVHAWPHDTGAYTQGLLLYRGRLLESVGREGLSDLREVNRETGTVRARAPLPATEFGEGIAAVGDRLYQLTWRGGRGYIYDPVTLARIDTFTFSGEGWGLTSDGRRLYMSNGTSEVSVVDPNGFRVERTIQVREAGHPVWMLNALEWVRGELWANVYSTGFIARIDPASGAVVGWLDVERLLTMEERRNVSALGGTANGIAFDPVRGRVLVTGKLWPRLFEVDVPRIASRRSAP
ncbi:MAG: glutaminyl-peptide cyclotransferase [Gemmatimonadaceae bacterium]